MDADTDSGGTFAGFAALLARLTKVEIRQPGTWGGVNPRVGLMVVPHDAPGELETLVWRGWCADPANAARLSCIQAFEGCMQAAGVAAQSPDKARLQALLSLLNDDDPRLGPGARARKLDLGSPALLPPVTFLRGVASP